MKLSFHKLIIGLVLIFWLLTPAAVVRADIAPPEPPKGSGIAPGSNLTQVRMMAEQVVIAVAAKSSQPTGEAAISADFQMRNLGQVEEKMNVRFPLCIIFVPGNAESWNYLPINYQYPPIDQFTASVNGIPARVVDTPAQPSDVPSYESQHQENAPCWANFSVVFPPGQDVSIKVYYHQTGYGGFGHGSLNYVKFSYILLTGAAWKDTIGSADVVVRLPMEANEETVIVRPQGAVLSGQEIRWHAQDFEPGEQNGVLTVGIMQPSYWTAIQKELQNVEINPKDGEAWGRLGKNYKAVALMERGWRDGPVGLDLVQKSMDAYQRAVDLLPNDADWHYGFAELLCSDVMNNAFNTDFHPQQMQYNQTCIQQLNLALRVSPRHPQANALLQSMKDMGLLKSSASGIDYLLLTPQPTSTPDLTQTIIRVEESPTEPASIPLKTKLPVVTATMVKIKSPTAPVHSPGLPPLCGGFLGLGGLILLLLAWHFWNPADIH